MMKGKKILRRSLVALIALLLGVTVVAGMTASVRFTAKAEEPTYTQQELYQEGYKLSVELEEDGSVLFQNEGNALPLGTDVQADLYGYMSYNIIHGGGGSGEGRWDSDCLQETAAFELAGLDVNDELWAWHGGANGGPGIKQESWVTDSGGDRVNQRTQDIPEVSVDDYRDALDKGIAKPESNVAVVTFGRQGFEGSEMPMSMADNYIDYDSTRRGSADRTYLDPMETELELLDFLKNEAKYDKIIVLINSANVMTLGEYMEYSDALLWIGHPGEAGLVGVAEVLMGQDTTGKQISPGGRTADTWMTDFYSSPVMYNNGGGCTYANLTTGGMGGGAQYNQYEEGIFMGYRWYETAYADKLVLEGTDGKTFDYYNDYDDIVAMPFGGGLSYTEFEWEVVSSNIDLTAGGHNSITVKVSNTGDYAGKDTVQIYVNAPYNEGGIDKAEVSLVGFAKTERLRPGESGTVTIEFETDDFASYDYRGIKNDVDGTDHVGNEKWGGWVLEAGEYEFRVQCNSHDQKTEPVKATLDADIIYNEETGIMRAGDETYAYNKINDVNAGDGSGMIWMSRNTIKEDWASITNNGTGRQDQLAEKASLGDAQSRAVNTAQKAKTTVTLNAPYKNGTKAITMTYGYQASTEPVGADTVNYWGKTHNDQTYIAAVANVGKSTTGYTADTRFERNGDISATDKVTTSTDPANSYGWDEVPYEDERWNDWVDQASWTEIVNFQGTQWNGAFESLGIDAISALDGPGEAGTGNKEGNTWWPCEVVMASTWNPELVERVGEAYGKQCVRTGITSCYGPAMNTHRSPFGGRNFEYYSEDGFLAGMMCLAETTGIQRQGVGTFNKHFMLNDLDGGRSGQIAFCNEQALREIYIRAWEFSMKSEVAPLSGMMASLNRIGLSWGNRGVYVGIIREEFGWHGLAITDGMDNVQYSGAVKAAFSGIACLLWRSTVIGDEANNDGSIFTGNNVNGGIADYYGAYMPRETMKQRLYYDTHIIAPEDRLFTMDYWQSINSVNYEEMPVSNLTAATQPETGEDPDEGGCGGTSVAGFAMIAAILAAALGTGFALRRAAKKK